MEEKVYIDEHPGIPMSVLKDMRERLGYDEDDSTPDEEILAMSGKEFLSEYLTWNGLIGYVDTIIEAIYMAYGISLEDYPFEREIKRDIEVW
jgi:hypothetical protein